MSDGQSPSSAPTGGRFAGLDGLRAVAIVTVLLFHLNASWLPGGFLGVDVFFVISGFLITSLLVREIDRSGTVDLKGFWTRRARRLLPALALCVLVSVVAARIVSGDLLVGIGRQVLGASTFSTNWIEIFQGQSYFDRTAPALFMNFWSLAVEEQFYLLWPLLVLLVLSQVPARLRWVGCLVVAAVSTVLMGLWFTPGQDATRVYYGTDTHLMGLMIGAALAFAWASPSTREHLSALERRLRPWPALVSGAGLVALMALLDDTHTLTFRGGITLACLLTAVLLLATINRPTRRRTGAQLFLDGPVVSWVGERSYGIYLWHWPVVLIVNELIPSAQGTTGFLLTRMLMVVLTLAIAAASFRWLEQPVRRNGMRASAKRALALGRPLLQPAHIMGAAGALLLGFAAILVTAPSQSETAAMLTRNQTQVNDFSTAAPTAPTTPTPTPKPTKGPPPKPTVNKADFVMPRGDEIDVFGDSMVVGSIHAIRYYFPGARVDAHSNRQWHNGLDTIRAQGPGIRRAVVLAFGTNAGNDPVRVREVLDALGPRRMVVIVDLYAPFSRIDGDNEVIRAEAARRPNVVIAKWAEAVREHPEELQADGIHPSLKGSHLYASTIRQALAELSERHTGKKVDLPHMPGPRGEED